VDVPLPRRVLIVSAGMGEGHNAAASALSETIQDCWPGCVVERLDTMELRGARFARAARWAYGFQLSVIPWSYAAFYDLLSRSDGFASAMKRALGPFFGRPLSGVLEAKNPDLVISTYPFGSAALDWLRAKRAMATPTVTYIPAFHVHPLWAYQGIDMHFVMYDSAPADARWPDFRRSMRLGAAPVQAGFGAFDRAEARRALGLPPDDFYVLVTGGAWGLGDINAGVEALVELAPPVHVLAVCGKNAGLRDQLNEIARTHLGLLDVYGYVSTMPQLMAAADVVVTNGAGVTVLEALRTPRPVVAFAPLAGHGTASTAEMVRRKLAVEARDVPMLVEEVRRLRTRPELVKTMEEAGERWVEGRSLRRSLSEIEAFYLEYGGISPLKGHVGVGRPGPARGAAVKGPRWRGPDGATEVVHRAFKFHPSGGRL
jgi:diacylglycerol O-acyltransferase